MKAHFRTIWQRFPCTLRPQPPSSFTSSAPLKTFYPCDFRWLLSSIERHLHAYWFFFFLSLSLFILFFIWAILKSDGVQACSLPVVKSIFLKRVNYENPFFFISVKERWEGKLKKKKNPPQSLFEIKFETAGFECRFLLQWQATRFHHLENWH